MNEIGWQPFESVSVSNKEINEKPFHELQLGKNTVRFDLYTFKGKICEMFADRHSVAISLKINILSLLSHSSNNPKLRRN